MLEYVSEFLVFLRLDNILLSIQTAFCLFGQLWCFHLLVTVNPALIRSHNQDLYTLLWAWVYKYSRLCFQIIWNIYPHVELLYHMVILPLIWEHAILFSTAAGPFYFLTSNVQVFKFLYILANTFFLFKKVLFYSLHPNGYEVVFHCDFICTFLMIVMKNMFSCAYWPLTHPQASEPSLSISFNL